MAEASKKVTIGGSYRKHPDRILAVAERFEALGWEVLRPKGRKVISPEGADFVRLEGDPDDSAEIQRRQLAAIDASDLYYVVNPGGYVGNSATGEVFHARAKDVLCYLSEPPFEKAVADRANGHGTPEEVDHSFANVDRS